MVISWFYGDIYPRLSYQQAPSLTPTAVKKLIETRNDVFKEAVNE
jgi:DEAD/DEAH box helicase domain-containing protein